MKAVMISTFTQPTGIGIYSNNLIKELKGVETYDWNFKTRWQRLFAPIKQFTKLQNLFREYDLVHVQYHIGEFMFFFLPLLCLLKRNTKLVLTLHETNQNLNVLIRWFHSIFYHVADKLIVHTEVHKRMLSKSLQKKAVVIPMGAKMIDNDKEHNGTILLPGFINSWKGHDTLIKAMAKSGLHKKLVFVGKIRDQKYYLKLKELQATHDVNIEWNTKFVSDEEYFGYLKKAELVVLPYRWSTMSAVLGEVVGMGKPCLLRNLGVFLEYTYNFAEYFNSSDELAQQLRNFFNNQYPDLENKMKNLREIYTWPTIAAQTYKAYKEVM